MIFIKSNYKHNDIKPLQDLNLINSFLFDSSMENPEDAKFIAKTIVKRATGRELSNFTVETQKEFKSIEPGKRGIKLDVLVSVPDANGRTRELYDIEPNDYYQPDLAKRTRFYNSLTDVKLLKSQDVFHELPELISIWILTYDPFGGNRMLYTVKNVVTEHPGLKYNDGVTNLFLYTEGTVGGSKELQNLLHHISHTTAENALDSDLEQIQTIVDSVKSNREVGERYMSMEKIMKSAEYYGYTEGMEKGLADGMAQGIAQAKSASIKLFIEALQELSIPIDVIKSKLLEKFELTETEADEYLNA